MRTIHWLFLLFAFTLLIPQMYFSFSTPKDKTFLGFSFNPPDTFSYKMWIAQYAETPFAQNLYDISENKLRFFNPLLFLESIPVNMGLDFWIIDTAIKLVLFGAYLLMLERFVGLYLKGEDREIAIAISVLFASPLTIKMYETVFLSGYIYSLSALHLFLQIVIMYIAVTGFSLRKAVLLFVCCMMLFLSHPYAIIYMSPILSIFFFIEARKRDEKQYLLWIFLISVILSILIFQWEMNNSEQYKAWVQYRFHFDFLFVLVYFLPFSLTAVFGVFTLFKRRIISSKEALLVLWAGCVMAIILFMPIFSGFNIPLQPQKFVIGLTAPLLLLSFTNRAVAGLIRKFAPHMLAVFVFCHYAFFALYMQVGIDRSYVKNDVISAFILLKDDPGVTVVMSSDINSVLSPFHTKKYSYPGHWGLSSDFEEKKKLSSSIVEDGDMKKLGEFCKLNMNAAVVTEKDEKLYDELIKNTYSGVRLIGDAAIIRCMDFE